VISGAGLACEKNSEAGAYTSPWLAVSGSTFVVGCLLWDVRAPPLWLAVRCGWLFGLHLCGWLFVVVGCSGSTFVVGCLGSTFVVLITSADQLRHALLQEVCVPDEPAYSSLLHCSDVPLNLRVRVGLARTI
jgi:hypothetical protein